LALEQLEDRLALSTYTVTTLADGGAGSLRDAITRANAHPGTDKINFQPGLAGLGGWSLANFGAASVDGSTFTGNSATGPGGGVMNAASSLARLTNRTVRDNSALAGGGISNQGGTLNVVSSRILNNTATTKGGGISTTDSSGAVIIDSVINTNQVISSATALGGGIDCENSFLSLVDCAVNGNPDPYAPHSKVLAIWIPRG
jgi:predicted outer membrane repeat protein